MYPGLTDTDCRAAEFRLRQLRVEADARRFARDHAGAADGAGLVARLSRILALPGRSQDPARDGRARGTSWRMLAAPSRYR